MKTLTRKFIIVIAILGAMSILASCSNDEETEAKRQEFVQIAESRSTAELLNDLYLGSDGDIEAIARILNCTPSSIERIRKEETSATSQFAARVVDVCSYYYLNEQSFSMLRAALDDEWGWYNDYLYFPKHHPIWFWSIIVISILLTLVACLFSIEVFYVFIIAMILEIVMYFICWIISLIWSPDTIQDRYQDTINPTIEQIDF